MASETLDKPTHGGLRILLNVMGVLCLLIVAWAFLPTAWLEAILAWWTRLTGTEPFAPFWYGVHTVMLVFVGVGWMFFVAARDPERHRGFLQAVMIVLAAWVLLCPVYGYGTGLPALWYLGDSISSLVPLVLLLALYPRRRSASSPGHA